ncbi:HemK2/MTQ2 family protein methyltransferase [Rhodococcoides fascians]|uniref:HemK2/MTQ2 family protein methyltransferase n=1 Tax=Rhodococcoides fascians TaxID=1828 RepID=UPI000564562B|nr:MULTISPECIES: HemK2/MTQ2 family protein methyltransferase [Rhodococcus]OZE96401.1 methylase [Rhodococcus sp. 15-1189-1-1a]OZF10988.1 methylase [Rhodococcus sp. 14-2686-1-2]
MANSTAVRAGHDMQKFFDVAVDPGVYRPQEDSWLLAEALTASGIAVGARVVDMCTGSGVLAVHAAQSGARRVHAFDIDPVAASCARKNAWNAELDVNVRLGSFDDARRAGPFDVVVCNPPYVPSDNVPVELGPARAWDAGPTGRLVLDTLCNNVFDMLSPGGTLLAVQSEFADPQLTLSMLTARGMSAAIVDSRTIGYGPVVSSRAEWLENVGIARTGQRTERLVVIRADKQ